MNIEKYRVWFIVGVLALMLLVASPALTLLIQLPNGSERFSEFWILGPGHNAEGYPFNVTVSETYNIYVGVRNHLGYSSYYRVYTKLRNMTQPLPVASNATPSALPTLYEFNFFVRNDEAQETQVNFKISEAKNTNETVSVNTLSINDVTFWIGSSSMWNNARRGFYFQLLFELWLYDIASQSFKYDNRYVGIWLNMTG